MDSIFCKLTNSEKHVFCFLQVKNAVNTLRKDLSDPENKVPTITDPFLRFGSGRIPGLVDHNNINIFLY